MLAIWLPIAKRSRLEQIERGLIALLSNRSAEIFDPPSNQWLGLKHHDNRLRESGLWNIQHTGEIYAPDALELFEAELKGHFQ